MKTIPSVHTTPSRPSSSATNRIGIAAILLALGVSLGFSQDHQLVSAARAAQPEAASADNAETPVRWGVILHDDVRIRCGRSDTYYPIGTLDAGAYVQIKEVFPESGWAWIVPPKGLTGFMNADLLEAPVGSDWYTTSTRLRGSFPKNNDPHQSWKRFYVEPGQSIRVLEEISTDRGSFYRVELPADVPVAIIARNMRDATPAEVVAWKKKLAAAALGDKLQAKATPDSESTQPPPPPIDENTLAAQPDSTDAADATTELVNPPVELEQPGETETQDLSTTVLANEARDMESDLRESPADDQPSSNQVDDNNAVDQNEEADSNATTNSDSINKETNEPVANEVFEATGDVTFEQLETIYEHLKTLDILEAEIDPLITGYEAIEADDSEPGKIRRQARVRLRLLKLRQRSQASQRRILENLDVAERGIQRALQQSDDRRKQGNHVEMLAGTLRLSSVYDGTHLPLRYRLTDVVTGRTLVYIPPKEDAHLETVLDETIRVFGLLYDDPALNVAVLDLVRFDVQATDNEDEIANDESNASG